MVKRPQILLPDEYEDAHGLMRIRPRSVVLASRESEAIASAMVPPTILAAANAPSFEDHVAGYITHQEIIEHLLEGGLATQFFEKPTTDSLIASVATLPFEPAMRFLASIQKAIWQGRLDADWQRVLMFELYGHGPVSQVAGNLLHTPQRALFTEQQVFALMRLVILYASDEMGDELSAEQQLSLRLALFYVPGAILQDATEPFEEMEGLEDDRWLRCFVGNGGLAGRGTLRHDLARAHRMYEVIAKSPAARRNRDYCPLDDWLKTRFGLSFLELQGLGFAIYAGSQTVDPLARPLGVRPEYFRTVCFANRVEGALEAIAEDRSWFKEQFERTQENDRYAAFEIHPFLKRPCLRQVDGISILLSPRGIESWLGSTGTYYRLLDIARSRGRTDFDRFLRFNGWIQERYVRHLVHVAHPTLSSTLAVRRVIPEQRYSVGRQEMLSNDVSVELGLDLVLFEVTAKRLTARSLIEGDAVTIARDLRLLVLEKMEQLGRVIRHLLAGHISLIDLSHVRSIWPVIVCADGVFHSPTLWAYVQREGGHHLDIPRVRPLVLLDLEDHERLMGVVQEGRSLVGVLKRKTSDFFLDRDLKGWHSDDPGRIGSLESRFIGEETGRAFRAVKSALGIAAETEVSIEDRRVA